MSEQVDTFTLRAGIQASPQGDRRPGWGVALKGSFIRCLVLFHTRSANSWVRPGVAALTSSLLLDAMRSMCCGSSVRANDTTEFLSFPSSRTCLWRENNHV